MALEKSKPKTGSAYPITVFGALFWLVASANQNGESGVAGGGNPDYEIDS